MAIGVAAFLASGLTLFSGFGLGTILLPVFALFFSVPTAVAATALVHFANNLFKFGLMAREANWPVVRRFGIPAALAAVVGANLLGWFDRLPDWHTYTIGGATFAITPIKGVIGLLIMAFALLELSKRLEVLSLPPSWLPVGGALSGFFGGLSGNQGALRSAFLLKAGLSKEAFVATGIVSAVLVDGVRLVVYGTSLVGGDGQAARDASAAIAVGCVCAFTGAVLGKRLLRKVTLRAVRVTVAAAMLVVGAGLGAGIF